MNNLSVRESKEEAGSGAYSWAVTRMTFGICHKGVSSNELHASSPISIEWQREGWSVQVHDQIIQILRSARAIISNLPAFKFNGHSATKADDEASANYGVSMY